MKVSPSATPRLQQASLLNALRSRFLFYTAQSGFGGQASSVNFQPPTLDSKSC